MEFGAPMLALPAALFAFGAIAVAMGLPAFKRRLELSLAKHRSLTGHVRMARRIAGLVPFYAYDEAHFFSCDDVPDEIAARRRAGFMRLAALYQERFAQTVGRTAEVAESISDLQFTDAYRVPFQFSGFVRQHLKAGAFVQSSGGVTLTDLDGNHLYDLTGSYGVNVLGYDFYKECMERGQARVRELGPVLGAYHPVIATNVKRLSRFPASTKCRFTCPEPRPSCRRYGWRATTPAAPIWCGFAAPITAGGATWRPASAILRQRMKPIPCRDMSEATLRVLRHRRDIACVLVNPLQGLHPNAGAPADSGLVDSARTAHFDRAAYTDWLQATARGLQRAQYRADLR